MPEHHSRDLVPQRSAQPPASPHYVDLPNYGYDYPRDEERGSSLLDYYRILRRRKGTVILAGVLGALAGFLIAFPQTPVYRARTTIELLDLNLNFMNMKENSPVNESSGSTAASDIQTQIRILQSDSMIESVVAKLNLDRTQALDTSSSRIASWRRALNLPEPSAADARQTAINMARSNLTVRSAGQTRIIEILVDSTDPRLAADFSNLLTAEFIDQNLEGRWSTTQRTTEWLSRQLDDLRIKLEKSEDNLQEYARRVGLVFTTNEQGSVNQEKLRQIQTSLSAAQNERIAKQSRYESARSSPADVLPDVLNDESLRGYQSKITDLRRQAAELSVTFTPAAPRVKRLTAQIEELESALKKEREAIVIRIRNDYNEALLREKLIAADYRSQQGMVTEEADKSVQYNILKREVDTYRQLFETMLARVKEAGIASAMRASNARVLDPGKPPSRPYKPQLGKSALMGLFGGLALGIAFVIIRERSDRTLQDPADIGFYLNVPELGVIPSSKADNANRRYYLKGYRVKQEESNTALIPVEQSVQRRQSSMVAESFRAALTSILFSGNGNGKRPRILVLTSPGAGEGKSTVAANLATALAEVNQRVLLIDSDLRKPRQHEIFGAPNEVGLVDVLRSREPAQNGTLEALIQETPTPNLFLLPSGKPTAAAANLLYSPRLAEAIKEFAAGYDMVVIDTPPMLHMPDARIIGRCADAVILVLRSRKTSRDAAQAAKQRLGEDGTAIVGAIFNDYDPQTGASGYGGYYRGYYHKSYHSENG